MILLFTMLMSFNIVPGFYKSYKEFREKVKWSDGEKLQKVYPVEDSMPKDSCLVWVGYSSDKLYILTKNWQKKIQASTRKRDSENIMGDDWLLVYLDTQGRGNEAYCFQFNPLGTKRDFILTEGGSKVEEWDGDWEVYIEKSDSSWDALLVIPFESISFTETNWGIQIERYIAQQTELQLLVKLPSFQQIKGIATLKLDFDRIHVKRKTYSLIPILELRLEKGKIGDGDNPLYFRYGATARFKEGTGTLMDFTLKPDFSDVECDIEQINLNRLPVDYPEKRPFFMEGKDLVSTPIQLVRSRNIEYPISGIKFYTRGKKLSFAGYFVNDSLLNYIGFSRASYSPGENIILGFFNTITHSGFNLYSMDASIYIPEFKTDISALTGREINTSSNILYVKMKRRQEFKGLGFSFSYLDMDSGYAHPVNLIYFDGIKRYSGSLNYQFLVSKFNINVFGDYLSRKNKYTGDLISEEYGPGLSISLAPFSLYMGISKATLNYTGFANSRINLNYIQAVYSLSSWKGVTFTYNFGDYFGEKLKYYILRLNLSPFNKFNIGIQEDLIECNLFPEENIFQLFGEIPLRKNLTLKPYLNYKKLKDGGEELAVNSIVSFDINSICGIYIGFTKNISRTSGKWQSDYEKFVFKIKAGYDLARLIF